MQLCWRESPLELGWKWRKWMGLGYILKAGWQDLLMGWVWRVKESGTKDNPQLWDLWLRNQPWLQFFIWKKKKKERKKRQNNWIYPCEMTRSIGNFFKKYSALCSFKSLMPSLKFIRAFLLEKDRRRWHTPGWWCELVIQEGSLLRAAQDIVPGRVD